MAEENRARKPSFSFISAPVTCPAPVSERGPALVEHVSSTGSREYFEVMPPVWQEGMTAHQNTQRRHSKTTGSQRRPGRPQPLLAERSRGPMQLRALVTHSSSTQRVGVLLSRRPRPPEKTPESAGRLSVSGLAQHGCKNGSNLGSLDPSEPHPEAGARLDHLLGHYGLIVPNRGVDQGQPVEQ